jgi:hypothetical protein
MRFHVQKFKLFYAQPRPPGAASNLGSVQKYEYGGRGSRLAGLAGKVIRTGSTKG